MAASHHAHHNPHHVVHHRKKQAPRGFLIVTVIVLIVAGIFVYDYIGSNTFRESPSERGQVFNVSSNAPGPQILGGFIDPYDPGVNEKQIFSVHVTHVVPVQSVSVDVKTDNKTSVHELKLLSGSDLDGYWQGRFMINDTHNETYGIIISAVSGGGTSSIEITLR